MGTGDGVGSGATGGAVALAGDGGEEGAGIASATVSVGSAGGQASLSGSGTAPGGATSTRVDGAAAGSAGPSYSASGGGTAGRHSGTTPVAAKAVASTSPAPVMRQAMPRPRRAARPWGEASQRLHLANMHLPA